MCSERCKKWTVALTIGVSCLTARAQSPDDLERCRAIADAAARLACYDAAAATAAAAKAKPPAAPQASPTPAPPAGSPQAEATKARPVSDRIEPGSQLVATGTTDRTSRSAIIAIVYDGFVSHTSLIRRGTTRSAMSRSRSGGRGAFGSRFRAIRAMWSMPESYHPARANRAC